MANVQVQVRRAYEDPAPGDGTRVLVDRIWPRGLTKARAALDEWCKEIAPGCSGTGRTSGDDHQAPAQSRLTPTMMSQEVIMTMRLRMPHVPTTRPSQRNNRHISCAVGHVRLTGLMLLR